MSTPDLHLLTGAYVLDALEPDERAEFEAHLETCDDCRAEVAELAATSSQLAVLAVEPPPAALRDRVLAAAASTRQLPPESGPAHAPSGVTGGEVVRPRSWARRLAMPVAAALLGVLALSLGVWGLNQRDRADQVTAHADLVASVLTDPNAETTSAKVGSGRATVVVSPSQGRAVLVGSGMPAPADGKVYELWVVDGSGHATPAGTYVPTGTGTAAVAVEGSLDGAASVAITVEPKGGSQQPTSKPVAAFDLPA